MPPFVRLDDTEPVLAILARISIFGGVTETQLGEILGLLESTSVRRNTAIFRKGDQPTHIYIIVRGRVDLLIDSGDVSMEKISLGVGEAFGEVSLMSMHTHSATAIASEKSEVLGLSRHALNQLRHDDLALFALLMSNIARELARRLKFTDDILLHYLHAGRQSPGSALEAESP